MLVEKEQVFDPHQGSSLSDTTEEAVDDTGSEVRIEAGRRRGPDACAYHDGLEEEEDGQASEETRQGDDEETARSDSEEVTDDRALGRRLRKMPLTAWRRPWAISDFRFRGLVTENNNNNDK